MKPPRVTPTKARRLVRAIAALTECEDLDVTARVALNDARAAIDSYLGSDW